jgi:HEAT repeat protein
MSLSVRGCETPQDEPVTTEESRPRRRSKRKSRKARAAKRARRKRLLIGTIAGVVLLAIGITAFFLRPQDKETAAVTPEPETPAAAPALEEPAPVAQATPKLILVIEPPPEPEVKSPAPAPPALEQPDTTPAVLEVRTVKTVARHPGELKRRRILKEEELREQLAKMPEVGLSRADRQAMIRSYETASGTGTLDFQPGVLFDVRRDLTNMPVRPAHLRQLDSNAGATLGTLSKKLHAYVDLAGAKDAQGQRPDPAALRQIMREEKHGKRLEWLRPEAVPVLRQLLIHEQTPIRRLLIELLTEITGSRAGELLAERAVFDLDPALRAAAVDALRLRPFDEFRQYLVGTLRYPWSPAADHAAEALAAIDDQEVIPQLVMLLNQPDPAAPFTGTRGGQYQRELVRVNHVGNCMMCHAAAMTMQEPVLGIAPGTSRRVTPGGWGGGGGGGQTAPFWVRADVTFFRQDFSESIPYGQRGVAAAQPTRRFDYLVRTRQLGAKETRRQQSQHDGQAGYEQREAVLFALRELTGKDPGKDYDDWLALYPNAETDAEVARWVDKFLKAAPAQRDSVLTQFRDGKNAASLQALVQLISKLPLAERAKVRDTLARRLAKLSPDELRDKLHDADAEIRRAAATACVQRKEKSLVVDLIPLLRDEQPPVSVEAHVSLKGLTGRDLGVSATAWEEWLRNEGEK